MGLAGRNCITLEFVRRGYSFGNRRGQVIFKERRDLSGGLSV